MACPEFLFDKDIKDRREISIAQEFLIFRTEIQVYFRCHGGDLSRFPVALSGERNRKVEHDFDTLSRDHCKAATRRRSEKGGELRRI